VGIALVLGSILIGARVLASSDDTVAVWQVVHDVPAGSPVGADDLRVTRVHFDQSAVADQYLTASDPLPPDAVAARDIAAAELLEVSAISSGAHPMTRELPLGVAESGAPPDLHAGDHVDVWAVPQSASGRAAGSARPSLVLHDVAVLTVGGGYEVGSGDRQVVVGVGPGTSISAALRHLTGTQVVLVRLAS
jgi:Flp pilus assembly protein CpaB